MPDDSSAPAEPTATTHVGYRHIPHARLAELRTHRAPKTDDERIGINGRIGVFITTVVGTMWAAYIFAVLSLVSLPAALSSGSLIIIVGWIAQTFLQLVLLPVIIVGQNVQASASDKRAQETYRDAEAILQECLQLQAHLQAQDRVLDGLVGRLQAAAPGA